MCLAKLDGSVTVKLSTGESFKESIDELGRHDAFTSKRDQTFKRITHGDDRTGDQEPEHRVRP